MAGKWAAERFPRFEEAIRRLTEQHRQLQDEPLHLAVAYQPGPPRDQQGIYLFEVIGGRGEGNPDKQLFETAFDPNGRLQTGFSQTLHLILTTPDEFKTAMEEHWPSAEEIVRAVRNKDYRVMHADEVGNGVLERLVKKAGQGKAARHG
ncbi:MAG TPA: hypothetical protein VMS17_28310 [Gemmataceae bacterium]|nr:hypothetical protein [Gemmataceae bacterium]